MYKDIAIQDRLDIERLKEKLAGISQETYYLFITGFNTGLKLQELLNLTKSDLMEIKKSKVYEIIEPHFWQDIETYMEEFADEDYIFPEQVKESVSNEEDISRLLYNAAHDIGIDRFGDETLSKSYGYFHYQKFRDIEKLIKRFGLASPTAALHYIGYSDDRLICFHCNIGCLWKIK